MTRYFNQSPETLTTTQFKSYLFHCKEHRKLSNSFINQTISALKILRQDVLSLPWDKELKIKRPRRHSPIPAILSKTEVLALLEVTSNPKHKAILALLYSSGIRLNELLHLCPNDIDSDRMLIRINSGKGNKSRDTLLAKSTLDLLRAYYRYSHPKPKVWLFEGPQPGIPYTASSVSKLVKRSANKAGIKKEISAHSLRHAFATHMLEQGSNLKLIQKLLGHSSLRSTMVYLHLVSIDTSVKSPLDQR